MQNRILNLTVSILAALGALSSPALAQAPPRSGEVFFVWSSADQALSRRNDFARTPANEVMPDGDDVVARSAIPSSKNGLLVDEPEGPVSRQSCLRVAAPRIMQPYHNHC